MGIRKMLVTKTVYKYILGMVDYFSKWLWRYPLPNKGAETVLINI